VNLVIGGMKRRIALGIVLATSLGPAAVSDARPSAGSTIPVIRVEYPDNTASLTYNENGMNGAASSAVSKPGDPLAFYVYVGPPAPGTNLAFVQVQLFNNTSGDVRFPGGLRVPVTLRSGQHVNVALLRHPSTRLAPGQGLTAQATCGLRAFGHYSASAFTVAQFTAP
jgi:hypothetical protein